MHPAVPLLQDFMLRRPTTLSLMHIDKRRRGKYTTMVGKLTAYATEQGQPDFHVQVDRDAEVPPVEMPPVATRPMRMLLLSTHGNGDQMLKYGPHAVVSAKAVIREEELGAVPHAGTEFQIIWEVGQNTSLFLISDSSDSR